jgi:tRNA-specific adenosine deaminase 3
MWFIVHCRALPTDISIQISEMKRFITAAIHLSQRVYRIQDEPPYNLPIATLIVDPSTSRILASTYDTRISTKQPLNHSVLIAINLLAMSPQPPNRPDRYFAYGYDFYTTHEPCLMCCMAMVHSRARRCVFWKEMKYTGGKSLVWKELSHKYMIFQWVGDESVAGEGVVEDLPWDVCA